MKIYDSSSSLLDKSFCEPTLSPLATDNDDLLIYTLTNSANTVTIKYAYFIKTWTSTTNIGTSSGGWALSYLKCKHYSGLALTGNIFFGDTTIEVASQTFSTSYCNGYTPAASQVSKYFSQSYFSADGTDTSLVHEFDITPTYNALTNFEFRSGDAMVVSIIYAANPWGNLLSCDILGGISSTSINQRAFCVVYSSTNIYIVNVGGFVANPLLSVTTNYRIKVRLVSDGLVQTLNSNSFNFYFRLFANYDACINGFHPIIYQVNDVYTANNNLCFYNVPGSCIQSQSTGPSGVFQVQSLSDTYMRVAFSPSSTLNFGTSTGYTHAFGITFNSFNFGPSCSISNVAYEYSTGTTPGSGTMNTVPVSSTSCAVNYI